MLDPAVKITRTSGATGFDPVTLLPTKNVVVTYMVGDHGPFTLTTPANDFTAEYVERETSKQAATLRALGAIPQA